MMDGAPSHRAHETVKLLKAVTPDFIPPNLWPPNRPDFNPVDYKNLRHATRTGVLYKIKIKDVHELREHIVDGYFQTNTMIQFSLNSIHISA